MKLLATERPRARRGLSYLKRHPWISADAGRHHLPVEAERPAIKPISNQFLQRSVERSRWRHVLHTSRFVSFRQHPGFLRENSPVLRAEASCFVQDDGTLRMQQLITLQRGIASPHQFRITTYRSVHRDTASSIALGWLRQNAQPPFFFLKELIDLLHKLHQLMWILLRCGLRAQLHPSLASFASHRKR